MKTKLADRARTVWRLFFFVLALLPYLLYIAYIIYTDRGPIDYETFMQIGSRLLNGLPVYGENSYYPMPYVMIFAFFAWLPRALSMLLWFSLPLLAVLIISKGNPLVLLFAPTFSHFLGGQTAAPALLGFWGYRRHTQPDDPWGGVWLALAAIKPQLAIFPLLWAGFHWLKWMRQQRRVPRQAWVFLSTLAVIYLPGFVLSPAWPLQWLNSPRPLFERALAGLVPRSLLYLLPTGGWLYWLFWGVISAALFLLVWRLTRKPISLDTTLAASFIINPLAHDYDLIQLIPLLETKGLKLTALLLSIPGWLVMIFAYDIDPLWGVFTIIPVGILWLLLRKKPGDHLPATDSTGAGASSTPS